MTDPVRIQVGVKLDKNIPVTYDFLRSVIASWADGERLPRGIHIVYIRWINNVRANLRLARWKDSRDNAQSLQGARLTLRGLLRTIHLEFFSTPKKNTQEIKAGRFEVQRIEKRKPEKVKKNMARKKPAKHKLRHVRKGKGVRKTK